MAKEISTDLSLAADRERPCAASIALRRAVWALAAAGLALRLAFALLPLSIHLVVLEDDAWMVTAIARNFALGRGVTADGVNPTNGFQPLYPLTLGALPYLAAPNQLDAGFAANLVLCALLNTLALWPLWWLARRFGGEVAGLLAAALFALNPFLIRVSVNAMETSLGLLLLLALLVAFYRLDLTRTPHVLGLALLTALATLARLDASLAFAAITLTMALQAFRRPTTDDRRPIMAEPRTENQEPMIGHSTSIEPILNSQFFILNSWRWSAVSGRWSMVALYIAATLAFLAPYFAFNYSISRTLGPSSGAALAYMHSFREQFHLTNGLNALAQTSALDLSWVPAPWVLALLALALAALLVLALGRRLLAALPLLLYTPVPPLYYGYMLQQARERYFVGLSAILIILLAWLGAELWRRRPRRAAALALGVGVALIVALNTREAIAFYRTKLTEPEQTQPTIYQAALWSRDNLPPGALIGAKNSGIFQYYSGHVALNIDGKLNHEIVPAMERRALLDYLRQRGVEYLVDREMIMADHVAFYSHQFGPAPEHHAPSLPQRVVIYGKILANTLGARLPLGLDARSGWSPIRPFSDAAEIVKTFERPNQAANPVVVFRLKPAGAPGVP
jgi:hypothetical protein